MASNLDILGFGALSVDDIVYVDRPFSAGKGKITGRTRDHGGNVATALVAVARLGGRAGYIGWLNDQPLADPGSDELARQGVDITFAPRRADSKAIQAIITVAPDGDRFIAYDDDVPHGTIVTLDDAVLAQAKVLMIDGYATHSESVVARARRLGLAVVADIEWSIGAATDRLIDLSDHLVLPLAFAQAQTGETEPAIILDRLWSQDRSAVILTDGGRGATLRQKDDAVSWHIPAYRVSAVDTTGAGDCFHGAYALALTRGCTPLEGALFATTAAAISVTGRGGRMALPDHDACLSFAAANVALVPVAIGR